MVAKKSRVANRIHKVLEDANIKLASVASEVLGKSGRAMLQDIIQGERDPVKLADHASKRLKNKKDELRSALQGHVSEHHRFMLKLLWDQLMEVEKLIARVDERIDEQMRPFEEAVELMCEVSGIDRQVAHTIIAETGVDMSHFPTHRHLASWAGMCPGNNESAGKRKSGKTTKGSNWLRKALVQAAWATSHTKNTYLSAQYSRLAQRRGRKKALVAVGHSILVAVYYILENHECYEDLGHDHFDLRNQRYLTKHLVKRLEGLGHKVSLEPVAAA